MRNLKRVLALALAVVMVIGMMVIGTSAAEAAEYDYAEAQAIVTGAGIFVGDEKGEMNWEQTLTREMAAKIMAYILLGEKTADKLVAKTQNFNDVAKDRWSAGYIEYCVDTGLIAGNGAGGFDPTGELTCLSFAKLLLVALGFDADAEGYVGLNWSTAIAVDAIAAGLDLEEVTLYDEINRQQAAQMILQVLQNYMIDYDKTYNKATDAETLKGPYYLYDKYGNKVTFGEYHLDVWMWEDFADEWGRLYDIWFCGEDALYAIQDEKLAEYHAAVKNCDLYEESGLKKGTKLDVYYNGVKLAGKYVVSDSNTSYGAQGRLIEVYEDRLVVIDTYLAKVEAVNAKKTHTYGHVTSEAYTELKVYETNSTGTARYIKGNALTKGDWVLVYVNENADNDVTINGTKYAYVEVQDYAEAFEGTQSKIWYNAKKHTINDEDYLDAVNFLKNDAGYSKAKFTWFLDLYGNVIGSVEIKTIYNYAVLKDINWNVGRPGYAEATIVYMDGTEATVVVNKFDGLGYNDSLKTTTGWALNADDNNADPILLDVGLSTLIKNVFPGVSSDSKYNGLYDGYALYEVTYNANGSVNLNGYDKVDNSYSEVVYWTNDATLSADGRQFIDYDGNGKVFMTADTEILVREGNAVKGYTYVAYKLADLAEYADSTCEIFYTYKTVNGNKIADRIYIKSGIIAKDFGTHLFVTSTTYYELAGAANTAYMMANVDGEDTLVYMPTTLAKYLSANKNKLFHVEYVENPYSNDYGMIDWAGLINEAGEGDCYSWCNYLSQSNLTVTGNTVICAGDSYTIVDGYTEYVGVADYDAFVAAVKAGAGVWVLGVSAGHPDYASVIYVGEKLDVSVDLTVATKNGTVVYDAATKTFTVTYAVGVTSDELTYIGNDANSVVVAPAATATGKVVDIVYNNNDSRQVTVNNEAATDAETYTVVLKWTKAGEVTLKSFCGYQAYAYSGSYTSGTEDYVTVKFLNQDKITFGTISAVIENATITEFKVWDEAAGTYIAITGDLTISDTVDETWILINYKDQAGVAGRFVVNAVYENTNA